VTGKPAVFISPDPKSIQGMNQELIETFQWFSDYGYFTGEDISSIKKMVPNMRSFEQWLRETGWVAK
jgi:hypothetical protein